MRKRGKVNMIIKIKYIFKYLKENNTRKISKMTKSEENGQNKMKKENSCQNKKHNY